MEPDEYDPSVENFPLPRRFDPRKSVFTVEMLRKVLEHLPNDMRVVVKSNKPGISDASPRIGEIIMGDEILPETGPYWEEIPGKQVLILEAEKYEPED